MKARSIHKPITQDTLRNELSLLEQKVDGKLSVLKQELKEEIVSEIDKKNEKYKDEVLSKLDHISGQLGNLREENIIGSGQTSELHEQVENHEKRIKNMEKTLQAA